MIIIWCIVHEISSAMNIIFWHFGPFFFFFFFLPFYPPNNKKIKILKNWKKTEEKKHIIILHKCTKNHDHMLHCSWDTMCDGCNSYFLFWANFCTFTIFFKKKTPWRYHHFTYVPKIIISWCMVPEI